MRNGCSRFVASGRPAGGRRLLWFAIAALLPLGCRTLDLPPEAEAVAVADGPMRWLMLPEEFKAARALQTAHEASDFLRGFWVRRAADHETWDVPARVFQERCDAADRLYGNEDLRGSLTERGRALLLLGAPPVQRQAQRRVPAWQPTHPGETAAMRTRTLEVETWVYESTDVSPELAAALRELGINEAVLSFLITPRETRLLDGERVLQAAVKAAVKR
jgi:GWxTD domain-containing protein